MLVGSKTGYYLIAEIRFLALPETLPAPHLDARECLELQECLVSLAAQGVLG